MKLSPLNLKVTKALVVTLLISISYAFAQQPAAPTPPQTGRMVFTQPDSMDFNDHEGYISIFDGQTLKGWDGNPKFWRVEDGSLVGESNPENPSGNNYIVNRDLAAKAFTLKFEVKVYGSEGTGMRSKERRGGKKGVGKM